MPVCFGDRVFLIALFLENMRANGTVISGKRGQELAMSNKKSRLKKLIIAQLHVFSHTPATAANGSHELSSCHSYSALLAISRLFSRPHSFAITANVMSIPALTPEDVKYLPSSIHRAFAIHSTFGA